MEDIKSAAYEFYCKVKGIILRDTENFPEVLEKGWTSFKATVDDLFEKNKTAE